MKVERSLSLNPNCYISEISAARFMKLTEILDLDDTWKRLLKFIPETYVKATDIHRYEKENVKFSGSPSAALIRDLGNMGVTVARFITYLDAMQLERALVLIREFEPVVIVNDLPSNATIEGGSNSCFRVECKAIGFPRPSFQWFKLNYSCNDWIELADQTSSCLDITPVKLEDEGIYCCRASNQNPFEEDDYRIAFSNNVALSVSRAIVIPEVEVRDKIPSEPPRIILQPQRCGTDKIPMGSCQIFTCKAEGSEPLKYEWYRNGVKIQGQESCNLELKNLQPENDETRFNIQCCVSNRYGKELSKQVHFCFARPSKEEQYVAEDKVALLIGNDTYTHHDNLNCAFSDVRTLGACLKKMDFKVLALVNLNEIEMHNAVDEFCKLLDRGVYAVFYYVGHGFERPGQSYMMPVDASEDCDPRSCLCLQDALERIQRLNPALCLTIMDMCRKNTDDRLPHLQAVPPIIYSPEVHRNTVCVYATSVSCAALDGSEQENGLFMTHLLKHIAAKKTITKVFELTIQDISVDVRADKRQVPEVLTRLAKRLSLRDSMYHESPAWDMRNRYYEHLMSTMNNFIVQVNEPRIDINVQLEPFDGLFLNVLEIKLSTSNTNFITYVGEAEPSSIYPREQWLQDLIKEDNGHQYVSVIFKDLQKIQSPLAIHVSLFHGVKVVAHAIRLELDFPIIAKVKLWRHFEKMKAVKEPEECDSGFVTNI